MEGLEAHRALVDVWVDLTPSRTRAEARYWAERVLLRLGMLEHPGPRLTRLTHGALCRCEACSTWRLL